MKNYDRSILAGTHILKITLQDDGYKGYVRTKIGGNCKGSSILNHGIDFFDFVDEDDLEKLDNDCKLELIANNFFRFVLKDEEGNECRYVEDSRSISKMIVAIEIEDYIETD